MVGPQRRALLILGLVAFALAACSYRMPYGAYPVGAAFNTPYQIDTGDQLRINVFGQTDLSRTYAVDGSGKLAMPLIGTIQARGRTTDQLENMIASALAAGYIRQPDVQVEVQTYRPFFILGEVRAPGQYPYVNGMTVSAAVAIAGGYTYRADQRAIEVSRRVPGEILRGAASPDMPVAPGDTITVHERYF